MRIALVALAFLVPAASAAEGPPAPQPPRVSGVGPLCSDPLRERPARRASSAQVKRLGELPPGDLSLAVLDRLGGCVEPRIVRQGIGAAGR